MEYLKTILMSHWTRFVSFALVLVLIVCSMTYGAAFFTDPQTYIETTQSIDEKKVTVLGVSAAIAGSATLLAAVPDDATTPLANEMMDLSSYLLIVVCILVLAKSLLTVLGAVACYIIFPVACIFALGYIVNKQQALMSWAIKLAILALAFLAIIPFAMKLSDYIYEVNYVSIEQIKDSAETPTEPESNEEIPWYQDIWGTVTDAVQNTVDAALDTGKQALNKFIDAVSVFIIAYCAIPILVVFVFIWLFKFLFGLNINIIVQSFGNKQLQNHKDQENQSGELIVPVK